MTTICNDDLVFAVDGWGDIGPVLSSNHNIDSSHVASVPDTTDNQHNYDYEDEMEESEDVIRILAELKSYMELLPHTTSSLNALLDAEHNSNEEKALGLLNYYLERKHLTEYTIEKELPRMEYTWIDPETGEFIQDKTRIAVLLWEASLSNDSSQYILPRCANQSLLADLIQFLTTETENPLIRTQFHMAVHTRQVDITIMPTNGTVLVKAALDLSLPSPSPTHNLVNIATVNVSGQFSPVQSPPLFHYHVESVQVVQPSPDHKELKDIAVFLQDLPSFLIEEEDGNPLRHQRSRFDARRDVFLQKTQSAWKHVNSGLQQTLMRISSSSLGSNRDLDDLEDASTTQSQPTENPHEDTKQNTKSPLDVDQSLRVPLEGLSPSHSQLERISPQTLPTTAQPQSREPALFDEPATKAQTIKNSLRRMRDTQKASWEKQMERLKSATVSVNDDEDNHRPSILGQATSRFRMQRTNEIPANTQQSTQPKNVEEGPAKWSGMLRSRWNRLASKPPAPALASSFAPHPEEEVSGEWVFTSHEMVQEETPEQEHVYNKTPTKYALQSPPSPSCVVPSPSTSSPGQSTATTSTVSTTTSTTPETSTLTIKEEATNSPRNKSFGGSDTSLLFAGVDVWDSRNSSKSIKTPPTTVTTPAPRSKENKQWQESPASSAPSSANPPPSNTRRKWPSVRGRRFQQILKFVPS